MILQSNVCKTLAQITQALVTNDRSQDDETGARRGTGDRSLWSSSLPGWTGNWKGCLINTLEIHAGGRAGTEDPGGAFLSTPLSYYSVPQALRASVLLLKKVR